MSLKFYKCNTCGNIIVKIVDQDTTPSCCGKIMTELRPGMTDGALEKHVPSVGRNRNIVCVTVGSVEHPMEDMHHIEFIVLETTKGFTVKYTYYEGCNNCAPRACFNLGEGEEPVAVYEYCNLHGLYVKEC